MSTVTERFRKLVVEHIGVEPEKVVDDAHFGDDLGCDSLDVVELMMAAEEEFDIQIEDDEAYEDTTFGAFVARIESKTNGA